MLSAFVQLANPEVYAIFKQVLWVNVFSPQHDDQIWDFSAEKLNHSWNSDGWDQMALHEFRISYPLEVTFKLGFV